MRFLGYDKQLLIHDESGQAIVRNHYHVRRTMRLCELILITEGTLYIHQKEDLPVKAGEIALILPDEEHFGYASSDFKMHWTHFYLPDDYSVSEEKGGRAISIPVHFKPERMDRLVILSNLLESYPRTAATQDVRNGLITTIMAELASLFAASQAGIPKHGKRFHTIINFILSNLGHNTALDVRTIAETFGYNEKYLYSLFRKNLNVTPHRYITDRKLDMAVERLLNTSDTVAAIALDLGYESPQHFMKQFKRRFGVTPSQFRDKQLFNIELYFDDSNK